MQLSALVRDARPGRGAGDVGPHPAAEQRRDRAGGNAAGDVQQPANALHRRLHGQQQPAEGARRARCWTARALLEGPGWKLWGRAARGRHGRSRGHRDDSASSACASPKDRARTASSPSSPPPCSSATSGSMSSTSAIRRCARTAPPTSRRQALGGAAARGPLGVSRRPHELELRFDRFYRHDDLTAILKGFAQRKPSLFAIESIGRSHEGRDIHVVTVTNTATGPAAHKPAFWVDGNIHAAELTASTACLYYLDTLEARIRSRRGGRRDCSIRARSTSARASTPTAPNGRSPTSRSSSAPPRARIPSTRIRSTASTVEDVDGDGRILSMRIADPERRTRRSIPQTRAS
mgnify:CR=1 FL=1